MVACYFQFFSKTPTGFGPLTYSAINERTSSIWYYLYCRRVHITIVALQEGQGMIPGQQPQSKWHTEPYLWAWGLGDVTVPRAFLLHPCAFYGHTSPCPESHKGGGGWKVCGFFQEAVPRPSEHLTHPLSPVAPSLCLWWHGEESCNWLQPSTGDCTPAPGRIDSNHVLDPQSPLELSPLL